MDSNEIIITAVVAIVIGVIAGYYITQWYHRLDERITQQHETNRLLRKLASEPYLPSPYLHRAREKKENAVSSLDTAKETIHSKGSAGSKILSTLPNQSFNNPE